MTYKPLHDRVIVQILPPDFVGERKSEGGIILPDVPNANGQANPVREATVLAVGYGEILYDGTVRDLAVKVGDKVLVHESEVLPIKNALPHEPIEGIISERQILAVVS